ncbi:MAG TPA: hypothetical protein VJ898_10300 [Natrialbaceae archaeon]|nr:hypothetical protein [Natrialbaceae archaeon]
MTNGDDDPWATRPRDTRERTCGHSIAPVFSVRHAFRVARDPAPTGVTVTRTYEATVEWTSALDLPGWLSAVADVLTPYEADRFGGVAESRPDSTADGRFLAAPVEATVRPGGSNPIQSEPYHYWNTPLARLQADDGYPDAVVSVTIDLVDGPEAIWSGASTAGGIDGRSLEGPLDDYSRVGVTITARERFRRSEGGETATEAGAAAVGPEADTADWEPVGESASPDHPWLGSIVDATVASEVRSMANPNGTPSGPDHDPIAAAVELAENRIDAAWTAFERPSGDGGDSTGDPDAADLALPDPYLIPEAAVRAALDRKD